MELLLRLAEQDGTPKKLRGIDHIGGIGHKRRTAELGRLGPENGKKNDAVKHDHPHAYDVFPEKGPKR